MSLWVDKYRPSSLVRLDYHKEQAAQLRNLVSRPERGDCHARQLPTNPEGGGGRWEEGSEKAGTQFQGGSQSDKSSKCKVSAAGVPVRFVGGPGEGQCSGK